MSGKMGKNLQHQESEITLKNHSPGCMWGILHHFHHNRWHSVKKRLPRKTHSPAKHSTTTTTDQESTRSNSETAAEVQQNIDSFLDNSAAETKSADIPPRTTHKSSMKSRIRALITEEMSRRKGRHRRSSSYPIRTQPQRPTPIHHSPADNDNNNTNNSSNPTGDLFDSVHSTASVGQGSSNTNNNNNRSCELCATMLNVKYLKQNEVNNKEVKQPIRDHTLVHDKLIYAIEPSKHDSLQESKLFMDALDLLNMRKEVFLKILQDPSSSLAHQLHFRRTNNSKIGLTKSVSFPVSGSSTKRDFNKSENASCTKEEDELQSCIEMTEESNKHYAALRLAKNSNPEQFLREMELSENVSSPPPPPTSDKNSRKRHDNKVVLKRFKNLREKLKHVIRDRKKEKNRIIMDAVHHKIPYGRNEDGNSQLPGNPSDYGKTPIQSFKRTSSFNESLDRYNRLLEISLNKEGKDQNSERLRFRTADNNLSPIPTRPASLARILSLPDLRSYSSLQIDDSTCYHTPDLIHAENTNMGNYSSLIEQKPHSFSESASQENLLDETVDDSTDSKTWESASSHDLNIEPMPVDLPTSKSDHISENDQFNYHEEDEIICQGHDLSELEDSKQDVDTADSQMKQFYNDIFNVETRNKANFNYVKDILELSGFSRDEILGKWHSAEHPVDPLLFDEIEGCLVTQPDYEEGDGMSLDHLLLFDLINEVLLDIYERSFCYWPMPLTSRSRVHRMPRGYRVLEEVWAEIRRLMSVRAEIDQGIDDAVSRDLDRRDGWMNLQLDGECVGLELEDLIFDDLLDEVIWT